MDEVERRIVAHEPALVEVAGHVDRKHLEGAMRAIRAGFVIGITEEERVIRIAAIELLEHALCQAKAAVLGMFLQRRGLR